MTIVSIDRSGDCPTVKANVLPCRISYNGPVNVSNRYWCPQPLSKTIPPENGNEISYFRGRKLVGLSKALPSEYEGQILQKTPETFLSSHPIVPQDSNDHNDDQSEDNNVDDGDMYSHIHEDIPDDKELKKREVNVMKQVGKFKDIIVWNHEGFEEDINGGGDRDGGMSLLALGEFCDFMHAIHSRTVVKEKIQNDNGHH